jgi:hypothetical protein
MTSKQRSHYERDGFFVIDRFVAAPACDARASIAAGRGHSAKECWTAVSKRAAAMLDERIINHENKSDGLPFLCRFEDATAGKAKQTTPHVCSSPESVNAKHE